MELLPNIIEDIKKDIEKDIVLNIDVETLSKKIYPFINKLDKLEQNKILKNHLSNLNRMVKTNNKQYKIINNIVITK